MKRAGHCWSEALQHLTCSGALHERWGRARRPGPRPGQGQRAPGLVGEGRPRSARVTAGVKTPAPQDAPLSQLTNKSRRLGLKREKMDCFSRKMTECQHLVFALEFPLSLGRFFLKFERGAPPGSSRRPLVSASTLQRHDGALLHPQPPSS